MMYATSREWDIDQRCKAIVSKMVDGDATPAERIELADLISERARRMTPILGHRIALNTFRP